MHRITGQSRHNPPRRTLQTFRHTLTDIENPLNFPIRKIWTIRRGSFPSQPSPHFSHDRERLIERSVLIQIFAKSRNEWPQTGLRHVWDQLIEHAALPEQRMGSVFGGVDLEMAVHAEAFAGGAEQRQKHDG